MTKSKTYSKNQTERVTVRGRSILIGFDNEDHKTRVIKALQDEATDKFLDALDGFKFAVISVPSDQ